MKNMIVLSSYEENMEFLRKLWRTDAFQRSFSEGGFIFEQCVRFAWQPRIFAEMTNEHIERAHFSTWWNVIMLREDYTNDMIHDLYYLHEMCHASTMPYVPNINRSAFEEKMKRNELEASVLSEILVYFEMPAIRQYSFGHEIYADRFLQDMHLQDLWRVNKPLAIEKMRFMRRDVMSRPFEAGMDTTETWIRRFSDMNDAYAIIWSDRYNEIETAMDQLQRTMLKWGDAAAITRWAFALEAEAAKDPVDNVPFRMEAEQFAPLYWSNKQKFDEAMKKEG